MPLKIYLLLISIATAICWVAWAAVLIFINPQGAGWVGMVLFYSSLFLALVGLFVIIGFAVRLVFWPQEALYRQLRESLRQAALIALMMMAVLFLQSQRLLFWWNIGLVVIIFSLVEVFSILYIRHNSSRD